MPKSVEYKAVLWYNSFNRDMSFTAVDLETEENTTAFHTTGFGS